MAQVVVVGSCMIDLLSYAPRLPRSGETLHGTKFAVGFGGKGCNQCVAARKLGAECLLVAKVGNDSFGRDYLNSLQTLGIPTDYVDVTEGTASGMAQIIVADNGENQIVIVGGANDHVRATDVQRCQNLIVQSAVLLTQMEIPVEATLEALRLKHNTSGISIFNAAPAQSNLPAELYTLPTVFCVNETETSLLTGLKVSNVEEGHTAIKELQRRGCRHTIITLGDLGVLYAPPGSPATHFPARPANVVDTTGAGDAFLGALAFFLSRSTEPNYAIAIQNAIVVASTSVERPGTQTSFPTLQELPELNSELDSRMASLAFLKVG